MKSKLSTIDDKDKEVFDKVYSQWWNKNGPFQPLHAFNEVRIKYIREVLVKESKKNNLRPLAGLKILDFGCGGGILTEPLARLGAEMTGIDSGNKTIQVAKKHAIDHNLKINYLNLDIVDLDHKLKFDVIICMEVLEHISNFELFFQSINKHLKKSGMLIGSTINKTTSSLIFAKVLAEYVLKIIPAGTHQWKKFVTPSKLKKIFFLNNLEFMNFQGSFYNPVNKKWKLVDSVSINYFFSALKN